jgi:hypothetical protein
MLYIMVGCWGGSSYAMGPSVVSFVHSRRQLSSSLFQVEFVYFSRIFSLLAFKREIAGSPDREATLTLLKLLSA